ncbi:MAG: hypothetical protein NT154_08780 [Verrucomicrobia bacterium]|nr:hypothetical protein [Verrucomicrobiota bacterium]
MPNGAILQHHVPVRNQADLLPDERLRPAHLLEEKPKLKPRLRAVKGTGTIEIDATTTSNNCRAISRRSVWSSRGNSARISALLIRLLWVYWAAIE